jgi:zinc protease
VGRGSNALTQGTRFVSATGVVALGLVAAAAGASPQAAPAPLSAPNRLDQALPLDPAVRVGRLPNGLTYYIRKNGRPEKRVSLRLAVKAGSVLEDEDQRGLAHFLEHMSFNGSQNFKPGELVAYLESIGARFGADANAYTSFDETVYMLDVPTDKPGLLDKGLLALGDFAARASLSDAEIKKERGVVLEEWRLGQGAGSRIQRQQLPVLFHGSRYALRLPIGVPEVLRGFKGDRVRAFHKAWYRPERMALVAVGDIEPDKVEAAIRSSFADIPKSVGTEPLPVYEIPPHAETLVAVATDPEARGSSVSVIFKHPRHEEKTVADFRKDLVQALFLSMVNDRLAEVGRRKDAPFLGASSSAGTLGQTLDTFALSARVPDGGIAAGLLALMTEAERVRRHGFAAAELDRTRKSLLAAYERGFHERDKSESSSYAREYVSHFLDGEPSPGIETEYRLVQDLLPGIALDEVRALTRALVHDDNRVVLATAPEKEGLRAPSAEELRAAAAAVSAADIGPWEDKLAGRELLEKRPAPGRVTDTRTIGALGVTVLTLGNGVSVWLKPTDFKNDQVLFSSYALGGASLADPADYFEATIASAAASEAGFGGWSPDDLGKLLAGKLVSASPYVGAYTQGVSGSSTPKDLETALQLVYLVFTQPNDRPDSFEVLRKRVMSAVANQAQDPESVFADKVREVNSGGHYMARALKPEDVPRLRRETALAFYRKAFANAADFTFFFTGAFDVEDVTPLVAQYLGALPSTGKRSSSFVDRGLAFPASPVQARVEKGVEPKSQTALTFFADTGLKEMEMYQARAAASVLRSRLRDILREELSGTYGASVGYSDQAPLPGYGTTYVSFGSAPESVDKLAQASLAEVARLQKEGPSAEDVQKVQEIERRELETSLKQNPYWLGSLQLVHMLGWDPLSIARREQRIALLTRDSLRAAFVRYFPLDRHTTVTLFPEKPAGDSR